MSGAGCVPLSTFRLRRNREDWGGLNRGDAVELSGATMAALVSMVMATGHRVGRGQLEDKGWSSVDVQRSTRLLVRFLC
jgi:hypothetical protein